MKAVKERIIIAFLLVFSICGYFAGCTHEDEILISSGPDLTRGNQECSLVNSNTTFDKAHSNVQWSTAYLGSTSLLTGRFDSFGFDAFSFTESDASGISFDAWVWLNAVNTSEPGRDDGCLLTTFGTDNTATTETYNVARIVSKSVTLSTTDKGYNVKADLTFHGVTKEISCKLMYDGKTVSGTNDVLGFGLQFQFLAKSDFAIASNNIGDNVEVKCNAIFRIAQ